MYPPFQNTDVPVLAAGCVVGGVCAELEQAGQLGLKPFRYQVHSHSHFFTAQNRRNTLTSLILRLRACTAVMYFLWSAQLSLGLLPI